MADVEVENILREIRDRVYAEQSALAESPAPSSTADATSSNGQTRAVESRARLESYLTTTGRAWDRLPPIVSNRSGAIARAELWLKQHLKRATRWYAWEQVNFNAAVHHALHDLIELISSQERSLAALQEQVNQLNAQNQTRTTELNSALQAARLEFLAQQRGTAETHAEHAAVLDELRAALKGRDAELDNRLEILGNEMRERAQSLQEEQRVLYRQLALESREAAVREERARRKAEALLEELQRRIDR
jgi:hypothetical protein